MSKVLPLLSFGFLLVLGGMYWALWDGSRSYLDSLVIEDSYYILMSHVWAWIPAIMLLVGIMCLIGAGILARKQSEVGY